MYYTAGMATARELLEERDARPAILCREAFRLAAREHAYRANVLARLRADLEELPEDLWTAIAWIWAVSLGCDAPEAGAKRVAVGDAAAILRAWFLGDEPVDALRSRWNEKVGEELALGSTLRSHPFADFRAWCIRPQFAAS